MLVNVAANHLVSGKPARRFGNGHPNIVPYRTFEAKDGSIAIAVGNDTQFAKFAACLNKEEWAADTRFTKNADRVINRQLIDQEIQNVIANKTVTEWLEKLLSSDIPASAVNSVESALADEQTIANDMVVNIEHSEAGTLKMLGVPYKFSDTPAQIDKAPPLLGEDNNDVLSSLGYDEEYIKELHTKNVI
tara:strand:- start:390 stop:959 length:570 start_codon:yes stop_codon:yes gene_type:complete